MIDIKDLQEKYKDRLNDFQTYNLYSLFSEMYDQLKDYNEELKKTSFKDLEKFKDNFNGLIILVMMNIRESDDITSEKFLSKIPFDISTKIYINKLHDLLHSQMDKKTLYSGFDENSIKDKVAYSNAVKDLINEMIDLATEEIYVKDENVLNKIPQIISLLKDRPEDYSWKNPENSYEKLTQKENDSMAEDYQMQMNEEDEGEDNNDEEFEGMFTDENQENGFDNVDLQRAIHESLMGKNFNEKNE